MVCSSPPTSPSLCNTANTHTIYDNSARKSWYPHFRTSLSHTQTIDEIENLLRRKVAKWRGKAGVRIGRVGWVEDEEEAEEKQQEVEDDFGDLSLIG
jgi:tRNA-dihydrouridine synthase 1